MPPHVYVDFVVSPPGCRRRLTLSPLMSCIYTELLEKPEMLTLYTYMDLRLATLKAVSFYLLYNVSTQLCVSTLLATKVTLITDGI
jgi:hypothetical protein